VAQEFGGRLAERLGAMKVGRGVDDGVQVGPLVSDDQRGKVAELVDDAVGKGAKVLTGAARPDGPGYFYEPTILTDVAPTAVAHCEEVFGPVASIAVVRDAEEAIARAAASDYGLGANIYTKNLTWAMQAMQAIKAGTFWINDPLTDNDAAPFGGMRKSGMGRELGEEGLDAFRDVKHVHMDFVPERKGFWFPYRNRRGEIPT
jgi:acyl-CoA reductase-like NAD-dependent aldehyde dehydrogenase